MRFVCIAGGPSLTREDVEYCRGKARVIVVNDGYRLAPWADYLYAADHRWWIAKPLWHDYSHEELTKGMAQRVTCDPGTAEQFGIRYVPHEPGIGLGKAPKVHGTNSGIEAVNFVANEGAKRILLLGYDFCGKGHWFGDHPEVNLPTPNGPLPQNLNVTPDWFEACDEMRHMALDLAAAGIEVVNCTRRTALTCFRYGRLEEQL